MLGQLMSAASPDQPCHSSSDAPYGGVSDRSRAGSERGWWVYVRHVMSVSLFFGGGAVLTLASPLISLALGRKNRDARAQRMLRMLFRIYISILHGLGLFRVRWQGAERLRDARGTMVVANHPGLLDVVFLTAELPRAVCVMRGSLLRNPAFSGSARLAGFIRNDRGAAMIRDCRNKLASGENVLIFPEGTRTRRENGVLNPFKGGFALAAVRSGAPIQCLVIRQSQPYLTQEMSILARESAPVFLEISVGREFRAEPGESARALAARVETYFREELSATPESGGRESA